MKKKFEVRMYACIIVITILLSSFIGYQLLTRYLSPPSPSPPPEEKYNITITASVGGTTNPKGTIELSKGSTISVTASPNSDYTFSSWVLDTVTYTINPITIKMDSNHSLKALFTPIPTLPPPETKSVDITSLISQTQVWTGSESWTSEQQQMASDVIEGFGKIPWQRYTGNPIINYEGSQGEVVILDGSTYKMFYGDLSGTIMLATSPDGKVWTRYNGGAAVITKGSTGAWDDESVDPGGVIKEGSTLKMWYHGYDGAIFRIGLATSTDGGYTWTKDGSNPVLSPSESGWDSMGVACCRVIKEGSTYKMWYVGYPTSGYPQIGYATSSDGTSWTKYGSNPVISLGGSGVWDEFAAELLHVFKIADKYVCFYEGAHDYGDPLGVQFKIGVAYSTDGVTWTKHPNNPVFSWGASGQWDDFHVLHPCVIWNPAEKMWYLYYAGTDGTTWATVAKIGLATQSGG